MAYKIRIDRHAASHIKTPIPPDVWDELKASLRDEETLLIARIGVQLSSMPGEYDS